MKFVSQSGNNPERLALISPAAISWNKSSHCGRIMDQSCISAFFRAFTVICSAMPGVLSTAARHLPSPVGQKLALSVPLPIVPQVGHLSRVR